MGYGICRQCGAEMEVYMSSDGGSYIGCSATSGSGSHEFVIADLQRQLQQAERQALLNLGQAWQREDITQAKLQQAQEELSLARENHITFAEDAAEVMVRYEAERDNFKQSAKLLRKVGDVQIEDIAKRTAERDAAIKQLERERRTANTGLADLRKKRDAAIERAEAAERGRKLYQSYWGCYRRALVVYRCMRDRNKRAKRDAAKQRALILRIHKVCKHTLEGDRSSGWYKMVVFDIGQLTTPAEAQGES